MGKHKIHTAPKGRAKLYRVICECNNKMTCLRWNGERQHSVHVCGHCGQMAAVKAYDEPKEYIGV